MVGRGGSSKFVVGGDGGNGGDVGGVGGGMLELIHGGTGGSKEY